MFSNRNQSADIVRKNAKSPIEFPTPRVRCVSMCSIDVEDHCRGRKYNVQALVGVQKGKDSNAYFMKKKLCSSTFGSIRICVVLKHRADIDSEGAECQWTTTDHLVVLKASEWTKIHRARGHSSEDPLGEAAALHWVGSYHEHVTGCHEVLQDEHALYVVLPYFCGGTLYSKMTLGGTVRGFSRPWRLNETRARTWFRQLLEALSHLQKKGVCHRDVCLENIVLNNRGGVTLVDFGLALRVPYQDANNEGGVGDVSEGTSRFLIRNQGIAGNVTFMAPEIVEGKHAFDGFAVDLWSSGVVLFVMLVGMAPFEVPSKKDFRFSEISKGRLKQLLQGIQVPISNDACHLLQNMLWRDPRKRLTLRQVLDHPWVKSHGSPSPFLGVVEHEGRNEYSPRQAFSPKRTAPSVR